uniref:Uncharacterized protein n=1 Tax=Knipowitschia caucasica TaxID=637954 RepID=A0AAV2KN76_KNICA
MVTFQQREGRIGSTQVHLPLWTDTSRATGLDPAENQSYWKATLRDFVSDPKVQHDEAKYDDRAARPPAQMCTTRPTHPLNAYFRGANDDVCFLMYGGFPSPSPLSSLLSPSSRHKSGPHTHLLMGVPEPLTVVVAPTSTGHVHVPVSSALQTWGLAPPR